jgi:hypothetical protein
MHLLFRRLGHRNRTCQVVRCGEYGEIIEIEAQSYPWFITELQTVGCEILTLRFGGVLRLSRFDGNAHRGQFRSVALELFRKSCLGGLIRQLTI